MLQSHPIHMNLTVQSLLSIHQHHLALTCIDLNIALSSSSDSAYYTKSSAYRRPGNLHSLPHTSHIPTSRKVLQTRIRFPKDVSNLPAITFPSSNTQYKNGLMPYHT